VAWTAPRTWVANEVVTASIMNTHVKDNLDVLKVPRDDDGRLLGFNSTAVADLTGLQLVGLARVGVSPVPTGWYRAHSVAVADGAAVAQWDDESGNARHFVQISSSLRPTIDKNAASSGFAAVRFNAAGARMQTTGFNMSAFLGANGLGTIFVVFRPDASASGTDTLLVGGSTLGGALRDGLFFAAGAGNTLTARNWDGSSDLATLNPLSYSAWHTACWMHDTASGRIYLALDDGDGAALSATPSGSTTNLSGVILIGSEAGSNDFTGHIAEIITFATALTQDERQRVHAYLAAKYSVTDTSDPAPPWAGNDYAGVSRFTGTSRFIVPVGTDKWETMGQGKRRGLWVEGDYLHVILQDYATEVRYLGTVVGTPAGAVAGSLWVEGTNSVHYISASGVERYIESAGIANGVAHADAGAIEGSVWVEDYLHWVKEGGTVERIGHADVAHSDGTVHSDAHGDVAHADTHTDAGHGDSHADEHSDSHTDFTAHSDTHGDHTDSVDGDPHTDLPHEDEHSDHSDHGDAAHADSHSDDHTDGAHGDAHSDSHTDSAHEDHSDHGDAGHNDQPVTV
jgi:hypothetical protein